MFKALWKTLCCLVVLAIFATGSPQPLLAQELNDEKITIAVNANIIAELEWNGDFSHVKVYENGLLIQEARGSKSKISLILYDGKTNTAPSYSAPVMGIPVETVHADRSYERFTGTISVNPMAAASGLASEPWHNNNGLTSVGSDWYSFGTQGGHPQAPKVVGELQRKYTQAKVGTTKSWAFGPGESVAIILAYITAVVGSGGLAAWIISFAIVTGEGLLAYAISDELDEYEFDYNYRIYVFGAVHRTFRRNSTYWRLNTSTTKNNWRLKSENIVAINNGEQIIFAIDNWLGSHSHDTCATPCSVCGVSTGNAHNWGSWTTTTAATCTASGTQKRTCTRNSSHTETRTVAALGHSWGSWVTTKAATCTATGTQKRTCSRNSGHTETRTVAALGHNYPSTWSPGNSTYHTKKCSRCTSTLSERHSGGTYCYVCGHYLLKIPVNPSMMGIIEAHADPAS